VVSYDDGQNVRDEERRVAAETDSTPAADHEDHPRRVPLWLVVFAFLAMGGLVEVIIYGYLERPGWIGVAQRTF